MATTIVSQDITTTEYESFLERNLPFSLEVLIGIVVGCVALLFLLCVCVACCCVRNGNRKQKDTTVHLENPKRKSQNNNYLNMKVPVDIGNTGQVSAAKKKIEGNKRLSVKINDVITKTLQNQMASFSVDSPRLTLGEIIGSGRFGVVYKAELTDKNLQNPEEVAVKTVQGEDCTQEEVQSFLEEVLRMRGFRHKHVLSMSGLCIMDGKPYAILPFMHNGDLKSYIKDPSREFVVRDLLCLCSQVADGMAYLSEQGFVHRDLAARNCMISKDVIVKIADFGLSRDLFTDEYYRMQNLDAPLPIRWMAVESLTSQVFSEKSDVWSFGVLMWEVIQRGKSPYGDRDNVAVIKYVKAGGRPHQPAFLPDEIYDMMMSCWKDDPSDRPRFSQLSSDLHDMLSGVSAQRYENIIEGARRTSNTLVKHKK